MFWLALLLLAPMYPFSTAENEPVVMEAREGLGWGLQTISYLVHDPIHVSGNDGFTSWPGSGSKQDPYVIEGLNITSPDYCIWVYSTTAYFVIRNCILQCTTGGGVSLTLDQVSNGAVKLCVSFDGANGIEILSSVNCTIEGCVLSGSTYGIDMFDADNCTLAGNTAYMNLEGIHLENTTDSLVVNNTCFRNEQAGINVSWESRRNRLFLNSLGWNPYEGGLYVNSKDNGQLNLWDDNISKGNLWNDYVGAGSYSISGTAASRDRFPSVLLDISAPEVSHPDDVRFDFGETGNNVAWQAHDRFPGGYILFWNGQPTPAPWNGDEITVRLDNLNVGVHNCTLLVSDTSGNTASDTVLVFVSFNAFGDSGAVLIAIASAVSVALLVASILVVKAMR